MPTYVIVLGILEIIIVPLLWRAGSKIAAIVDHIETCVESIQETNDLLSKIIHEQADTRVRDAQIEGRIKGIDGRLQRIEQTKD